jgi:hypothetical protein
MSQIRHRRRQWKKQGKQVMQLLAERAKDLVRGEEAVLHEVMQDAYFAAWLVSAVKVEKSRDPIALQFNAGEIILRRRARAIKRERRLFRETTKRREG